MSNNFTDTLPVESMQPHFRSISREISKRRFEPKPSTASRAARRGLENVTTQVYLTTIVMNLKKLAATQPTRPFP